MRQRNENREISWPASGLERVNDRRQLRAGSKDSRPTSRAAMLQRKDVFASFQRSAKAGYRFARNFIPEWRFFTEENGVLNEQSRDNG